MFFMKSLEVFDAWVSKIDGDTAYIDIESRRNNDRLYGEYPIKKLAKYGINEEHDHFSITVKELFGKFTYLKFKKIPPRELTNEEILEIKREIEEALPDYPEVDY